ncbi:hypothetical protein Glove_668g12 [Diversispora epigaea]|uniref:Uncharacterized protein n=1 Tax=Diversispora epigaea TaxID=1348612 RepID=A0A397G3N5_9GLOM|nr:hypothetical protein Glove_668g12 [Diversispora epigaea]
MVSYVSMVSALWPMLGEECCGRVASLDLFFSIPSDISILRPYGRCPLADSWRRVLWQDIDFRRYVSAFASNSDCKDWNVLNCLQYPRDYAEFQFTSDSKQNSLLKSLRELRRLERSFDNNDGPGEIDWGLKEDSTVIMNLLIQTANLIMEMSQDHK